MGVTKVIAVVVPGLPEVPAVADRKTTAVAVPRQARLFRLPAPREASEMPVVMAKPEMVSPTTLVVAVVELDRREAPLGMFRVGGLVSVVWDFGFLSFQH